MCKMAWGVTWTGPWTFAMVMAFSLTPSRAAGLDQEAMIEFLTQGICLDSAYQPTNQIPIVDACVSTRPQTLHDRAAYQKRDWADKRQSGLSRQASDAVLDEVDGEPVIEQTFDFGDLPGRSFGRFDRGDGGQVILLVSGWASIVMTEDSGGGVQWFISEGCPLAMRSHALGWLLFDGSVSTNGWQNSIAKTSNGRMPINCPDHLNDAYTRYRRDNVEFPIRVVIGGRVTQSDRIFDVIITEHFGGSSPNLTQNAHLERFYFARDFGMVRWERWQNGNAISQVKRTKLQLDAQDVEASSRCPTVKYSVAPGPGWYKIDCRMWTTLVKLQGAWSVSDFHWLTFEHTNWPTIKFGH